MEVTFINQISLKLAYGILCGGIPSSNLKDSLVPTFCKIPGHSSTTPHSHFEPEIFFIIQGHGTMSIGNESKTVSVGDLIRIPSNSVHSLKNTQSSDLEFLSIYNEDYEIPQLPKNVLITAAPPTPNGPLHIGHISGPYLASDIVARYLKLNSSHVRSHCGTDDHQNYVAEKSHSLNQNVDVFQKNQRDRIQNGLQKLSISFDEFIEPKSSHEYQFKVHNFVNRALSAGVIEKETLALPHCSHCDLMLIDVLASGICPACHSPSHGGCENCGLVVPPHHLLNVQCGRCGQSPEKMDTDVYTFNLSCYLPLIENDLEKLDLPPRLKKLTKTVAKLKDHKVIVSHPNNGHRGLAFGNTNQNLHVWFEMAAHYESFAHSTDTWIHFFGFDNSFHYLLFIPALLRALNPLAKLPDVVITNEFLLLDNLKFSTSRNHAIWADEISVDTDHLRLYLAANRPTLSTANFSLSEFNHFSERLERHLKLLSERIRQSSDETLDLDVKPSARAEQESQRLKRQVSHFMSPKNIDLRQAAQILLGFIDHTCHSLGLPADDTLRIETLFNELQPFMPNKGTI